MKNFLFALSLFVLSSNVFAECGPGGCSPMPNYYRPAPQQYYYPAPVRQQQMQNTRATQSQNIARFELYNLPNTPTEIFFTDDKHYTQGETFKSYSTAELEPNVNYVYKLSIRYKDVQGQIVTKYQELVFRAGQTVRIDVSRVAVFSTSNPAQNTPANIRFEAPDQTVIYMNGRRLGLTGTMGGFKTDPISPSITQPQKIQIIFIDAFGKQRTFEKSLFVRGGESVTMYIPAE